MSKFEALLENTLVRYQRSQFLTGDLIKFKKNWQKNGWVQANPDFSQKIMQFIESGDNLRVSAVKSYPSSVQGSYGSYENEQANLIDITQEFAPGLYRDFMTVPSNIIEVVDTGNNLAPIPDSKRRKDSTTLSRTDNKINSDKGAKFSQDRQTGIGEEGDRKLNNKNVTMPHGNKWNDKKPGAGNTKDLKKVKESFSLPKHDADLIFEAYMNGGEKSFAETYPVGTKVQYRASVNPGAEGPTEGTGIVEENQLSYGEPNEDKFWGVVKLDSGDTVEARIEEITPVGGNVENPSPRAKLENAYRETQQKFDAKVQAGQLDHAGNDIK